MDKNKPIAGLSLRILQSAGEVISKPDENRLVAFIKFSLFLVLALLVIATEPLKLLMRKNIGEDAFEKNSLMVCCVLYAGWGGLLYYFYGKEANPDSQSMYIGGMAFYGILVGWLLYVWIFEHSQEQDKNDKHRGDSVFFGSLTSLGFSDNIICAFVEPLFCLTLSALIVLWNFYVGLPILITSISFLANEIHEVYFIPQAKDQTDKKIKKTYDNKIRDHLTDEKYHRVN